MTREYIMRTVDCPDCFEGRYEIASGPGYVTHECEECSGTGELDASCAECGKIEPLDSDGYCERCADSGELPIAEFNAKYGMVEAETRDLGGGWFGVAA